VPFPTVSLLPAAVSVYVTMPSELQPELQDPSPDRLVRNIGAAFCQEFLDVAVAEREAQIKPDGAADDARREPVAGRGDGRHSPPNRAFP
jgi:hypothetical protein